MADHRFALSVALAPGSGLIGRREHTLLYIPEPDERVKVLLDAFTHGPVDETWDRLAEAVIDQGFDVCDFSCIAATEHIEIRVFGKIELRTDLRSVPMLSGAGSGTWVEHRVPSPPRSASITTSNDGVDERTGLVDGIVHAGGFTAALVEQRAVRSDTIQISPPATTVSIPRVVPADDSELMSYVNRMVADHGDIDHDETDHDETDHGDTARDDTARDDTARDDTAHSDSVEPSPDLTLEPPALEPTALAPTSNSGERTRIDDESLDIGPMTAARVCKAGHANPPSRTTCEVCDVFLPAGSRGVGHVPLPSLGALVFDDGRRIELTADVMIGRNPSRNGDRWIPVVIEGDRISRTHLTVRCSAWDVLLEDAGSHNGTVVVPTDGSQPVALVPGTPYLIEPGATAYFGSSSLRFEGRSA